MDTEELIKQIDRLKAKVANNNTLPGVYAEVCEFFRIYVGRNSEFLVRIKELPPRMDYDYGDVFIRLRSILSSFRSFVEEGLLSGISPKRKAQIDVVSDFLEQAQMLLEKKGIHPAAAVVIIGASLEEFLRTWIENEGLSLGNKKPSLDSYSKLLKENDLIDKQDCKDILAWGGLRNHAAHGEWDQVKDKGRITNMLEGVNLFMRKYTS